MIGLYAMPDATSPIAPSHLIALAVMAVCLAGCERESPPVLNGRRSDPAPRTQNPTPKAPAGTLTVFAAASTTDVLREAAQRYEASRGERGGGIDIALSLDSSSNLARQIKAGAPADVFISADERWMDDVEAAGAGGAIQIETREDLLANELVLIAPIGKGFQATLAREFDFAASLPHVRRIAVGDPSHVPAGRYARQALESLGWWSALKGRLIPALDVRAALRLVELGEADAGIVYATDAKQSDKIVIVAMFPLETHEPIRYPIALCKDADARAADFLQFLRSDEMTQVFEDAGFRVLRRGEDGEGR